MNTMLLPKELLALVVEYLEADDRTLRNLLLSCKIYFKWMASDKLFDKYWKMVARNIRRQLCRDFSEFDASSASTALSALWYQEVLDLDKIKQNWRSGICRTRAVDMHNYGCFDFCKYDSKHFLLGSGNGNLLVMKIFEQQAKELEDENKDAENNDALDNSLCTAADRANSSRVSLRKKHKSSTWALKTVRTMKCNTEALSCCLPFLRAEKFVTGGWDCKVKIWDFEKMKPTRVNHDFGSIEALDIYDDRQLIVGTSTDDPLQIYDIASQAVVATPARLYAPAVWQVELNQTNNVLAFGCMNGDITLYDVKRNKRVHDFRYYSKSVRSLKWQTRSEHLLLVSTEGSVLHQWDTRRLDEPLRQVPVPTNRSEGVYLRLNQNDHIVVAMGSNGMLYVYDAKSFALLYMLPAAHESANSVVVDEFNAYMGFTTGSLRMFDFDVLPEHVNVNPKTKLTPKSTQKLIGMHGLDYRGHVY